MSVAAEMRGPNSRNQQYLERVPAVRFIAYYWGVLASAFAIKWVLLKPDPVDSVDGIGYLLLVLVNPFILPLYAFAFWVVAPQLVEAERQRTFHGYYPRFYIRIRGCVGACALGGGAFLGVGEIAEGVVLQTVGIVLIGLAVVLSGVLFPWERFFYDSLGRLLPSVSVAENRRRYSAGPRQGRIYWRRGQDQRAWNCY